MKPRQKISRSISTIEVALSEWGNAKNKPKKLARRIEYLQFAYKLMYEWERESLKGPKDLVSIMKRLQEYTDISKQLLEAAVDD